MQLTIDGLTANSDAISFSESSPAKPVADQASSYELVVDAEDFLRRFGPIYADCITELARDDRIVGEFQPPYAGAQKYPSLEELFSLPEASRMEMIDTFFVFDILRLYVKEDAADARTQWHIVSLDSLSLYKDEVAIRGRAVASH